MDEQSNVVFNAAPFGDPVKLQMESVVISGEFQPHTPELHIALDDMLNKSLAVTFAPVRDRNLLGYTLTIRPHSGEPSEQDLEITGLRKELQSANAKIATDATVIANLKAELAAVNTEPPVDPTRVGIGTVTDSNGIQSGTGTLTRSE